LILAHQKHLKIIIYFLIKNKFKNLKKRGPNMPIGNVPRWTVLVLFPFKKYSKCVGT
jgi:hypothetical protein